MPTLQPLWETDPVQYLAFCKFPELTMFWKPLDGERRLTAKDRASMIEEADAYKESLWNLPDAEIDTMVEKAKSEEKARYLERQEQEEKQRPFNQPYARADVSHWASASYWTLDEGVALSLGKEPRIAQWEAIEPVIYVSAFARTFNQRRDLVQRAKVMGQLWDQTSPSTFLAWAERMRFPMPEELVEAVKSLGTQIADWKTLRDQACSRADQLQTMLNDKHADHMAAIQAHTDYIAKTRKDEGELADGYKQIIAMKDEHINSLEEHVEALVGRISGLTATPPFEPREKPLMTRERESLLKLVISMAIKKYNYRPEMTKNSATTNIATALRELEIPLDEDTIRKYLNEAKDLLPGR